MLSRRELLLLITVQPHQEGLEVSMHALVCPCEKRGDHCMFHLGSWKNQLSEYQAFVHLIMHG